MGEEKKPTLFISYCQRDGNSYADDLETELNDYFYVKRDKSKLIPNDDIYDFMAGIANEDYVIIVLTNEYTKSRNCMLEMAYLASQDDWKDKSMVLVIDESIYSAERKLEILTYWNIRQQKENLFLRDINVGRDLLDEEKDYLELINSRLEYFLLGISRRKNPSQIAIVNEMVRKLRNRDVTVNPIISRGEEEVKRILEENGAKTLEEICKEMTCSRVSVSRFVRRLLDSGQIEADGSMRQRKYSIKE